MHVLWLEIETERTWPVASFGPAYIAAYLRKHGHEASLFRVPHELDEERVARAVEDVAPDLVAVSLTLRQWHRARRVLARIRARVEVPVIVGGPLPSFHAAEVLEAEGVDLVCIGEGEVAMLELLVRLEAGERWDTLEVRNIRVKGGPPPALRPPIANLDALPWPARDLLDEAPGVAHVSGARGCPFICAHCSVPAYRRLYGHLERYERRRSAQSLVDELVQVVKGGEVHYVVFVDNVFNLDTEWLRAFFALYPARVGLPFAIRARAETMNRALLEDLAKAGCRQITYQVGSGSWRVRQEILRRPVSSQRLVQVFDWTRSAGMDPIAEYTFGLPGETRHDLEATFKLHQQLSPFDLDYQVFFPFPGTPLFELCRDKGYLPANYLDLALNHHTSFLTLPSMSREEIERAYARFTRIRERTIKARYGDGLTDHLEKMIENQVREAAFTR